MIKNVELARRVLDHVKMHPEQHNQGHWIGDVGCGTVACLAGWTKLFAMREATYGIGREFKGSAEEVAIAALGITGADAASLFYCGEETAIERFETLIKDAENATGATQ